MNELIKHIFLEVKNACKLARKLNDDVYFELTKDEVINYLEVIKSGISKWEEYLINNNINLIIKDYKKFESMISELEICLLDYDEEFNIRDISCSYFKLGEKLVLYKMEDNNGK